MMPENSMLPDDWTVEETDSGALCLMDEDGFMVVTKPNHPEMFRRLGAALHWHGENAVPDQPKTKRTTVADA